VTDEENLLGDPAFQGYMRRRSRLRWGFTVLLIVAYLGWGLAGLYIPDTYGVPFPGSSIPWGIVIGYAIIGLSIILSLVYIVRVNRMKAPRNE